MGRSETSDRLSSFKSTSGISKTQQRHQQFACDRCRGQKLRCIRTPNAHNACERCQKAGATCVVDPSVRMGRPQRGDKERRGTANSRKSQPAHSPESPIARRPSSHKTSQSVATNDSMWLDHGSEDTMGSNLAGTQCLDSLDFVLQGGAIDDEQLRITPPEDCFDVNFDFISPPVPRTMPDFGIYEFGSEAASGSLEPGPFMPIEHAATSNPAAEKPNPGALVHVSSMQQESVEQMSALNVEIHRQLSVVSQVAKEYATTEPSLMDSTDQRNRLSSAVVSMIQGLQTFQTLLLEILGAARQGSPKEPASRASMHSSQKNDTSLQTSWTWLNTKNDLSSIADADMGDTISDFETGDRQTISRSDTNSEVRPIPESPSQITWLDMPTSLLIISCYINLIQLCRDVFAAIRGALSVPGHQTTLLELSGFQISGVSIHEDSDLQIIVLTQVVVRLIDRIGLYLGYSGTSTAEAGKRDESDFNCKTISPKLLDFVLGQKEMEGQPSCKERIEALREEIRKLSEVVYKPI